MSDINVGDVWVRNFTGERVVVEFVSDSTVSYRYRGGTRINIGKDTFLKFFQDDPTIATDPPHDINVIKVGSVWTRTTSPQNRVTVSCLRGDRVHYTSNGMTGEISVDDFLAFFQEESVGANSTQVGGEHYKVMKIQPWDFIDANGLGYVEGMVIKYICRYRSKNGVEDLHKAKHAIDKLIERLQQESVV